MHHLHLVVHYCQCHIDGHGCVQQVLQDVQDALVCGLGRLREVNDLWRNVLEVQGEICQYAGP